MKDKKFHVEDLYGDDGVNDLNKTLERWLNKNKNKKLMFLSSVSENFGLSRYLLVWRYK